MNDNLARDNNNNILNEASQDMALKLFHTMAVRVPAYKDFLKKEGVKPSSIQSYDDFTKHVPIIDKKNYMSQYPLAQLCLDGDIFNNNIISVSSGSTGVPFFWPRGEQQDKENTELIARIFDTYEMKEKKTLLVLCFSMGTWIAGTLFEASSINYANQGNPVSILTPGIEKINAIDAIKRLSKDYEQVVIGGYPPFVKDLIEEGARLGIRWPKLSTRLIMGGESFSEEWRDYVLELLGSDNPYDATNLYGVADVGVVGHETPLSITIRRAYNSDNELIRQRFGTEILPSLSQFDPSKRHIEKVDGELVITSNSGIPLVRYNLKDTGDVLTKEELVEPVAKLLGSQFNNINETFPFVYLNGRKDFSITFYGLNVYPENIKAALVDRRIRELVTGKFTMATVSDNNMDQTFELNIELTNGRAASDEGQKLIETVVLEKLTTLNSEFRKLHDAIAEKASPNVHLITFGDQSYFARGVKHKWARKES
jgi:phenylacetate-CoA ligase